MSNTTLIVIIRLAQVICVLFFLFFIFFWLMAIASGHAVPTQTYIEIVAIEIILITLILLLNYLIYRIRKRSTK